MQGMGEIPGQGVSYSIILPERSALERAGLHVCIVCEGVGLDRKVLWVL